MSFFIVGLLDILPLVEAVEVVVVVVELFDVFNGEFAYTNGLTPLLSIKFAILLAAISLRPFKPFKYSPFAL